eukprot:4794115-Pleurochrysis_carterae.AAC.1
MDRGVCQVGKDDDRFDLQCPLLRLIARVRLPESERQVATHGQVEQLAARPSARAATAVLLARRTCSRSRGVASGPPALGRGGAVGWKRAALATCSPLRSGRFVRPSWESGWSRSTRSHSSCELSSARGASGTAHADETKADLVDASQVDHLYLQIGQNMANASFKYSHSFGIF